MLLLHCGVANFGHNTASLLQGQDQEEHAPQASELRRLALYFDVGTELWTPEQDWGKLPLTAWDAMFQPGLITQEPPPDGTGACVQQRLCILAVRVAPLSTLLLLLLLRSLQHHLQGLLVSEANSNMRAAVTASTTMLPMHAWWAGMS